MSLSEPLKTTLYPHKTGTFFVSWNHSDTLLATCAGDQIARISSPETSQIVQTLRGHEGTVKCAAWNPHHPDLLSTGARDGSICLWDLRVGEGAVGEDRSPVVTIAGAHEVTKSKARKVVPVPKGVTGLMYDDAPHQLVSSGSADG
jgi:denticleless